MTREQQRDFVRRQVSAWMTEAEIGIDDVEVAVDILIRHWIRTKERLPSTHDVTLPVFCDCFYLVLMEQREVVRREHWARKRLQ